MVFRVKRETERQADRQTDRQRELIARRRRKKEPTIFL